jgi:tyrosinase
MSDPNTAAQDPIFWLHHANIDRLWAEWLRSPTPHTNPTESRWLQQAFEFGSGAWRTSLATDAVLDSRSSPLRYRYDEEPVTAVPVVPRPIPPRPGLEAAVRRGPPEVIGATQGQIALGPAPTHAEIEVAEARAAGLESFAGDRQPQRVYLKVENVRGTELSAGSFHVYVNAPAKPSAAELEDHLAGTISLFGLEQASRRTERHAGEGLSFSFDITDLVRRLQAAQTWNPKKLRVTFAPIADSSDRVYPGDLKVGRVSLYRG